jgi:hypothetical protein
VSSATLIARRSLMSEYRVLITGSRTWTNRAVIERELNQLLAEHGTLTVVHGACPSGADNIAQGWALDQRHASSFGAVTPEPRPADWKTHGRRAGRLRNAEMVGLGANLCLVFVLACTKASCDGRAPHDTHGTGHCAALARRAGIEVRRIEGESSG